MITKYEAFYKQIKEKISEIKEANEYSNYSLAFGHWYLEQRYQLSQQEISEALIDGSGDNGIDAIILNEEIKELVVIQFKFPESENNINKSIKEDEIIKLKTGFNRLIGKEKIGNENKQFKYFREELKGTEIFTFNFEFVTYNKGIGDNKYILSDFQKQFEEDTGSKMNVDYFNNKDITNLFEKLNRINTLEVSLPYKNFQQAYTVDQINSFVGVVNAEELISSIKEDLLVIFDENIRLLEKKSSINAGIRNTASGTSADMFYFYNNGITFICDNIKNSPNSLQAYLKGASIVNGCQTVNTLASLADQDELNSDVNLLVRVIEISDYEERSKITQFLNSQNQIKDSYFISNHSIIRDLQSTMEEDGYFLERQINEREYKEKFNVTIDPSLITLRLEDAIQYYTGYWSNTNAATAKRGKGALFDEKIINGILQDINSEKVIEAHKIYLEISDVITKYRKYRRNPNNDEFSTYLGITQGELRDRIEQYLFMNTGDILLLNTYKNLKFQLEEKTDMQDLIKKSIEVCKEVIASIPNQTPATLTKTTEVFNRVQEKVKESVKQHIQI